MTSMIHRALLASVAAVALIPAASFAQVFQPEGPGHATGSFAVIGSADEGANGTASGAVQAIIADPTNPNILYIGAPNGGIWETVDGGKDWTPLTDHQASLSIDSLAYDPTDPTHQTILGGIGITDNGAYDNFNRGNVGSRGADQTGLLYSTDGGKDWADLGSTTFAGQSVDAVAARGNVILAGTSESVFEVSPPDSTSDKGLYRSSDGGKTFTLVSGAAGSGLPPGPVTAIVGDPNNPNRLYAAITAPDAGSFASSGVYVSDDTGAHWTQIFGAANSNGAIQSSSQTIIRMAVGPNGSVAIGVLDQSYGSATGIFLSRDDGSTWSALPTPYTNPGAQATPNFAIAIDPKNQDLVYVSGDNICYIEACNNAIAAFRIDASTNTVTDLGDSSGTPHFTASGTTVHPDSRALVFDASGRLLVSSDGGIYARTNPQNNTGDFTGLNGNLSVFEAYAVAFDGVSDRLVVSAQDAGSAIQTHPGSTPYTQVGAGDGTVAQVNDRTLPGLGVFYTAFAGLGGLQRNIYDASGNLVSPLSGPNYALGVPVTCDGGNDCGLWVGAQFSSPLVLNKVDPTRIAMAGQDVFLAQDILTGAQGVSATSVDLTLTDIGSASTAVSTLAYGARDNLHAVLAGDYGENLYLSTTGAPGSMTQVTAYNTAGGAIPTSLVFDTRTAQRFFVADSYRLFGSTDSGASIQDLSSNLPQGFTRPTSVEFVSNNGVNALLVGGLNQPLSCSSAVDGCMISESQSPITVADSSASGVLSNWRAFGQGLPNALIYNMNYDQLADVLAVSSIGRGAWLLYDFTSYFPQATQLHFGLANNDSAPDASFLTDGTTGGRPLVKYGSGTLLITGAATYTGGTTIEDGTLQLGNGGTSGSILGNVVDNGLLVFDRSDAVTFGGDITGFGSVIKTGAGSLTLTGDSNYAITAIDSGVLTVNGQDLSHMLVGSGGMLSGNGTVGAVTVLPGGVLAPGDAVGTLTINGNLTLTPGSQFIVRVEGPLSDRALVTGSANLAGSAVAVFGGGGYVKQYDLIFASGGVSGTFSGFTGIGPPSFLDASLSYTSSSVLLNLTSDLAGIPDLGRNQLAVATSLDTAFNTGSGSIPGLFSVSDASIPAALSVLSGEGIAATQDAAFGAADLFTKTLAREGLASGEAGVMGETASRSKGDGPWHAWATGYDQAWSLDGQASFGSSNLKHQTGGLAGGFDYRTEDGLVLGGGLGGTFSSVSVSALATHGSVNGFHAGMFAEKTWPTVYATGALGYGWLSAKTTRNIEGIGPSETETGHFNDKLFSGRFEVGGRQTAALPISPFVSLGFTRLWQDGISEVSTLQGSGAGVMGLDVAPANAWSVVSDVGAQVAQSWTMRSGAIWTPYVRLAWEHEFEPNRSILADFQSVADAPAFRVDAAHAVSDAARVEAGTGLQLAGHIDLFADVDAALAGRGESYGGRAGLRVSW